MKTITSTISAPFAGWNTRDPIDQMKEGYATKLINMFPDQGFVRTRKGFRLHCSTGESATVQTLMEYPMIDGTTKLIAGCNGKLINVTTATPATLGSGFTNNKWQHTIMNNVLIMVNGSDTPRHYNGTTLSSVNYQPDVGHDPLTSSNLVQVTQYKSRLYFVEKNSTKLWYGGVKAITSSLKQIDLSSVLQRGGSLSFCAPWSRDTGAGLQDYLVVMSSEGEVLVYSGTDPDNANDWGLMGRFYLTPPVAGRRSYINLGSDLLILHKAGVTALGSLLTAGNDAKYASVSDIINKSYLDATTTYGDTDGWNAIYHPTGQALYINIPVPTASEQFVLNPTIGAWGRYIGINASHFALMEDNLYFGSTDGKVYQADYGYNDNGIKIRSELKTAYSYFRDRAHIKRFSLVRPVVKSWEGFQFSLGVDCDFKSAGYSDEQAGVASSSLWNVSPWDTTLWASEKITSEDVYSLTNLGRCVSLSLAIETNIGGFEIYAATITYEQGGIF